MRSDDNGGNSKVCWLHNFHCASASRYCHHLQQTKISEQTYWRTKNCAHFFRFVIISNKKSCWNQLIRIIYSFLSARFISALFVLSCLKLIKKSEVTSSSILRRVPLFGECFLDHLTTVFASNFIFAFIHTGYDFTLHSSEKIEQTLKHFMAPEITNLLPPILNHTWSWTSGWRWWLAFITPGISRLK